MLSQFLNQLRVHLKHSGQRQSSSISEPREELGTAISSYTRSAFATDIPTQRRPRSTFGMSAQPTDDFVQKDLISSSWN
ncbi:hypothetical protein BJV82DRAFT_630974 [Fennellomyces sp. T-0311]|nr:hypothetical protein BJV82DRAFT_630974 [Fennellomyces sp. T-0311]